MDEYEINLTKNLDYEITPAGILSFVIKSAQHYPLQAARKISFIDFIGQLEFSRFDGMNATERVSFINLLPDKIELNYPKNDPKFNDHIEQVHKVKEALQHTSQIDPLQNFRDQLGRLAINEWPMDSIDSILRKNSTETPKEAFQIIHLLENLKILIQEDLIVSEDVQLELILKIDNLIEEFRSSKNDIDFLKTMTRLTAWLHEMLTTVEDSDLDEESKRWFKEKFWLYARIAHAIGAGAIYTDEFIKSIGSGIDIGRKMLEK